MEWNGEFTPWFKKCLFQIHHVYCICILYRNKLFFTDAIVCVCVCAHACAHLRFSIKSPQDRLHLHTIVAMVNVGIPFQISKVAPKTAGSCWIFKLVRTLLALKVQVRWIRIFLFALFFFLCASIQFQWIFSRSPKFLIHWWYSIEQLNVTKQKKKHKLMHKLSLLYLQLKS